MTAIQPGVCLTFDDLFVENWLAARPLFDRFDARVTFCVTMLHMATEAQLDGLHQLQNDGHEIALHSRTHPRLRPYLERHGIEHWLAEEVDAGIREHRAAGFPATSFACPYHASTHDTRRALGTRFEIVRTKGPRGLTADRLPRRVYRQTGRHRMVHNIGSVDFRHVGQGGTGWFATILDSIADGGGVGIFTGHDIRLRNDGPGRYATLEDLERALAMIRRRGLKFHTLTGFARAMALESQADLAGP
ncbi:polysaccharide deacetylase family protein [Oceanomicrobium pacificus]|uniref:Chitooligosaccharide deacetylase n=1 Tax=Oceanomicrobium pacificus TaxID=2692916 RepID=A0A6B0TSM8_9RHOB|nr:polysaccharide deacetylase family protein [Oceanomicrobium pacificus]MXU64805.1 polysaccharide deacetylase family protein [Oceanomicrobium pacificus]